MATVLQMLSKAGNMAEVVDENNFKVVVNNTTYKVTVSYEGPYISHYKIETDCQYLLTLSMDEEGTWHAENDVKMLDEGLIEQIGRAIEEHDDFN
jgi:hypothetical protein